MSNLETISIKVGDREKEFLHDIAEHFKLYKRSSTELSYTKALQLLIEFCLQHNINPTKKEDNNIQEIRKMIEQIHASIPHVLYQNSLQSTILFSSCNDETGEAAKHKSIDYINSTIAGFQNNHYKYVKAKLNKFGAKTIPLEEGESLWS